MLSPDGELAAGSISFASQDENAIAAGRERAGVCLRVQLRSAEGMGREAVGNDQDTHQTPWPPCQTLPGRAGGRTSPDRARRAPRY